MLNKVTKCGKAFLVFLLMLSVIVYAFVGFWCFSSILLGAIFGLSTSSASAVMFIVFVMAELFSIWREEAKAKAAKEAGEKSNVERS